MATRDIKNIKDDLVEAQSRQDIIGVQDLEEELKTVRETKKQQMRTRRADEKENALNALPELPGAISHRLSKQAQDAQDKILFLRKFLDPLSECYLNFPLATQGLPIHVVEEVSHLSNKDHEELDISVKEMISRQAELNLMEVLLMRTGVVYMDKDTKTLKEVHDPKLLKIKSDTSKFVKETLDSSNYSKKLETTKNVNINITKMLDEIETKHQINGRAIEGQVLEVK